MQFSGDMFLICLHNKQFPYKTVLTITTDMFAAGGSFMLFVPCQAYAASTKTFYILTEEKTKKI